MYGFDIKLVGMKNLNRALNGDKVVVEMLPESGKELILGEREETVKELKHLFGLK